MPTIDLEKGFLGGFLVLAFATFIVGFITGMLSFGVLNITADWSMLGFMIFALGFISGALAVALTYVIMKLSKMQRNS